MGSIIADARDLAERLTAAGCPATHDPAWALNNRPLVLVTPPTIDYSARTNTWQLACLADQPAGGLAALAELDDLLGRLLPLVDAERAEPRSYTLATDQAPAAAYVVTVTT